MLFFLDVRERIGTMKWNFSVLAPQTHLFPAEGRKWLSCFDTKPAYSNTPILPKIPEKQQKKTQAVVTADPHRASLHSGRGRSKGTPLTLGLEGTKSPKLGENHQKLTTRNTHTHTPRTICIQLLQRRQHDFISRFSGLQASPRLPACPQPTGGAARGSQHTVPINPPHTQALRSPPPPDGTHKVDAQPPTRTGAQGRSLATPKPPPPSRGPHEPHAQAAPRPGDAPGPGPTDLPGWGAAPCPGAGRGAVSGRRGGPPLREPPAPCPALPVLRGEREGERRGGQAGRGGIPAPLPVPWRKMRNK